MAYVRHDVDCNQVSPQPISVNRTDAYGNTYDDWCGDYESRDVDCNLVTFDSPPGYTGPIATFLCTDYLPHTWEARYVDNTLRPVSPYQHDSSVYDTVIPTGTDPLIVDETDLFFELRQGGVSYKLTTEEGGVTIIPEDNTNFLETPDTLANIYSEASEMFTLEHLNVPIEVEQYD
jgi:hypothetical protein